LKFAVKTLEEVDEVHRSLYVEDKDVGFKLAVVGIDDPAEVRRAKIRESDGRKAAEAALAEQRRQWPITAQSSLCTSKNPQRDTRRFPKNIGYC
jgi:hypothetical protein